MKIAKLYSYKLELAVMGNNEEFHKMTILGNSNPVRFAGKEAAWILQSISDEKPGII